MPESSVLNVGIVAALSATFLVSYQAWRQFPARQRQQIRAQLPNSLPEWRDGELLMWSVLTPMLRAQGLELWRYLRYHSEFQPPGGAQRNPNGYSYVLPQPEPPRLYYTVNHLRVVTCYNPLTRMVRSRDGTDMAMRVLVVRHQGQEHLHILRKLATGDLSFDSTNHTLPMFGEVEFEDIVFGLFPVVTDSLRRAYGSSAQNSVGDLLDMILQALEALAFIHSHRVAHRDAFKDNFLLDYHPESLVTMTAPTRRPRVYLIDFEVAVQFPTGSLSESCVLSVLPLGGSIGTEVKLYARPHAPEMDRGDNYNAFAADTWQFGSSLYEMKTTISAVDAILSQLRESDLILRPTAEEALLRLQNEIQALPPSSLLIPPSLNLRNDVVAHE